MTTTLPEWYTHPSIALIITMIVLATLVTFCFWAFMDLVLKNVQHFLLKKKSRNITVSINDMKAQAQEIKIYKDELAKGDSAGFKIGASNLGKYEQDICENVYSFPDFYKNGVENIYSQTTPTSKGNKTINSNDEGMNLVNGQEKSI